MRLGKDRAFSNEAEDCSKWIDMRRRNHAYRMILWILSGPEEWKRPMIEGTLCQESNRKERTSKTNS